MNPFGIVQAVLAVFEAMVHAADPKRVRVARSERRRFLIGYYGVMLVGLAVVVWVVYSLYWGR